MTPPPEGRASVPRPAPPARAPEKPPPVRSPAVPRQDTNPLWQTLASTPPPGLQAAREAGADGGPWEAQANAVAARVPQEPGVSGAAEVGSRVGEMRCCAQTCTPIPYTLEPITVAASAIHTTFWDGIAVALH